MVRIRQLDVFHRSATPHPNVQPPLRICRLEDYLGGSIHIRSARASSSIRAFPLAPFKSR